MMVASAASPSGSPTRDHFNFMPYLSAPSSPKRFGEDFYLSAPTSPSSFYSQFDYFTGSNLDGDCDGGDDGFAFSVGGGSETPSRSAEELFHGGKIKPLHESSRTPLLSPRRSSPIAKGKKAVIEAFSPRRKKEVAESDGGGGERRGRDRTPAGSETSSSASKSGRRVTRSLSPYRVSHYTWEEEHQQRQRTKEEKSDLNSAPATAASSSSLSSTSKGSSGRKWRLRDFLLFRSASEGRGSSTDPLRKFHLFYKKGEEVKASSSTSTSFRGSETPRLRRKEPVSAHELHYARKRAETEDLKKRTFLPYKQGILGRLAGLGSITR